jgi:PAS domain-containing protein
MKAGSGLAMSRLLPDALLLLNDQGLILAANPPAERLLGGGTLDGRMLADVLNEPHDRVADYLRACAGSHVGVPSLLRIAAPDAEPVTRRFEGACIGRDEDGLYLQLRAVQEPQAGPRRRARTRDEELLNTLERSSSPATPATRQSAGTSAARTCVFWRSRSRRLRSRAKSAKRSTDSSGRARTR